MASLTEDDIGKEVTLRARIDHVRPQSEFGVHLGRGFDFPVEEAGVGVILIRGSYAEQVPCLS